MKELNRKVCKGLDNYFTGEYSVEKTTVWKTKIIQRIPIYEYMGEKMTIRQFQRKYKTSYNNIVNRMKKGYPLNIAHGNLKVVEYKGKMVTKVDLAKKLSTNIDHLNYNIRMGYEIDKPHRVYRLKDKNGEFRNYRLVDIVKEFCNKHRCKNVNSVKSMISNRIKSKKYKDNDSLEYLMVKNAKNA